MPLPPWQHPVPVRRSRFSAADPALAPFNVEVALGRIAPFVLDRHEDPEVAAYDLQTSPDGCWPGRLGSGRSAFFRGHYLKGIGRTPAAANWNDPRERYHGSGHLAPSSAASERLISVVARRVGLTRTIVPCVGLLAADARADERAALAQGRTSASPRRYPADGALLALSVKRGSFARISNVVFALDRLPSRPSDVGGLFLAIERALGVARPGGDPDALAVALEAAFLRGCASFEAFTRHGLHWLYVHNNVTLDGRFADLELPLFLGAPAAGYAVRRAAGGRIFPLGFEVLSHVASWRGFVRYLDHRLAMLDTPLLTDDARVRLFLRAVRRAVVGRLGPRHLLFDDPGLRARTVETLVEAAGPSRTERALVTRLARWAWAAAFGVKAPEPPPCPRVPVRGVPLPMHVHLAPFASRAPSPLAEAFVEARRAAGAATSAQSFLRAIEQGADTIAGTRP